MPFVYCESILALTTFEMSLSMPWYLRFVGGVKPTPSAEPFTISVRPPPYVPSEAIV